MLRGHEADAMSAQEHDYELGMLDEATLERDESLARRNQQRGDERRWMILGGAGTLALMTALGAALALSGSSTPHNLAASLGSPFRDVAAVAAHLSVQQAEPEPEPAKPTRVARRPAAAAKSAPIVPAAAVVPQSELPSQPEAKAAPAAKTVEPAAKQPVAPPVDDEEPFAGLPTLVDEPASEDPAPEAAPAVDFAHDDNPFAEDDEEDEGGETGSAEDDAEPEPEAQVEEPAATPEEPAAAPEEAPAPAPTPA